MTQLPTIAVITPPCPLTDTHTRIFELLFDGESHSNAEILRVGTKGKRFGSDSLVPTHIYRIRAAIRPHGFDILKTDGGYRMEKPEVRNG